MGRRRILRIASAIVLALSIAALVVGPANAQEGCTFQTIVNRSRNGNDGMVYGTFYEDSIQISVFRGSKRLGVTFRDGEDVVVYHQNVKAIPSKTSLRVLVGDETNVSQLDIDVVARRAGSEPRELSYEYSCQPLPQPPAEEA